MRIHLCYGFCYGLKTSCIRVTDPYTSLDVFLSRIVLEGVPYQVIRIDRCHDRIEDWMQKLGCQHELGFKKELVV